jgi:hypothetical protein
VFRGTLEFRGGQSQGFRQMYVIIEKIILYYIWIIYIIKNYYFKLFKEGGSAKHILFLKGAIKGRKSLGTAGL